MAELKLTVKIELQPDGKSEVQWRLSPAAKAQLARQAAGVPIIRDYNDGDPIGRVEAAVDPPSMATLNHNEGAVWLNLLVTDEDLSEQLRTSGLGTRYRLGPAFRILEQETITLDAGEDDDGQARVEEVPLVTSLELTAVSLYERS